jgi:hypothetical protein
MSGTFQGRIAFASIKFTAGVPSFLSQSGDFDAAITDNGAGDVTLTLANPIDPDEAIYTGSTRSAIAGAVTFKALTDTTIRVFIDDFTGTGADYDCDICILVKPIQ